MNSKRDTDALLENVLDSRLDRRALLKRAAILGFTAPVVAGLLAACGDDDADDDADGDADVDAPATDDEETEESEVTEEETEETEDSEETEEATETEEETDEETEEEATETEEEAEEPAGEGQFGGTLRIALIGQPTSLDIHTATSRGLNMSMWHVFEPLFTWDSEYQVTPLLAESHEANDDSTVHTITLRQGIPFHNGDEMVAADVVASINRFFELSPLGQLLAESTDSVEEIDDYTIEFSMSSPLGTVPQLLARGGQGCAIYPASVIEAAGDDFVDEYIGTGPYQFTEMQSDRYILLSRFDDYVSPEGEASGYAGEKIAYVDELEFVPVPDEAARVAGLQSGDYHYVEEVVADQIQQLEEDPNVVVQLLPIRSHGYVGLNHREGLMSDLTMRKAVQAALSFEEAGLASHGEGFFDLGPGIMLPVTVWDSDAGSELYNIGDPELAAQYLEEAGYDGTPVRWITTQEDLGDYNSAVVHQQQLEEAGFTVELVVYDEATLFAERGDPSGWDIWNGAFILRTDPTLLPYLSSCEYHGWWCSDEKEAAFESLLTETDFDARFEAFETLQRLFYEEVGAIKQQDNYGIMTVSAMVQNFGPDTTHFELEPEFTNAWLEEM